MEKMAISHNFIGGRRVASSGNEVFEVRSPYDGGLVGTVPAATKADVDAAVAAAREAFDNGPWPRMTPAERQAVIRTFTGLHAARQAEFAQLISRENGETIMSASAVQQYVAPQNAAFLAAAAAFPWEVTRPGSMGGNTQVRALPLGVVGAIIPWNAPHQSALVKLLPALLAGCTVVLKLAPETGLDGHLLGELFNEAGVPEGVVSILTADRAVSEYLVGHPGVDKIAFTGSTAAGRRIASVAGAALKRVSLELGGKSASIVLPDADLAVVASALRYSSLMNNGQSCVAHTRILVPAGLHDRFVAELVNVVESLKIGDPSDPESFIGARIAGPATTRTWLYRGRHQRGRDRGDRRTWHAGRNHQRCVRSSDGILKRQEQHAHCPGGDLWAGSVRHSLPQRRGSDRDRKRFALRPMRRRLGRRPGTGRGCRPADSHGHDRRER
jgi:acyl-CoA reductase-like NAD-dependent aldehyde dehydrogenase